ncbi:MAG: enoyl-CoA hydratase/carnithine racemase, partial [Myxococcota bacterium]
MTLERVVDLNDARLTLVELAGESTVESGSVRLELARPVARLTIDNPGASNAMTIRMMAQLAEAVLALGGWDGAALVLSAVPGRAFCAGGHLRDVRRVVDAPERAHRMAMAMGTVLDALLSLPITSVAAVSGLAVGGGAELITAVDHRVFDSSGRVHF